MTVRKGDFLPAVSIITPAFNAGAYIQETIASVQAQTFENWEMWVVDDGSMDDTVAVVEKYSIKDSRVHLVRQPKNAGPAMARDRALQLAGGRYIAFLDSDDCWLPKKLSAQIFFMTETGAAVSFTRFRRVSRDGSRCGALIRIPDRLTYKRLLGNTAMATSTVMVDRALTGPFRMKRTYYDDFALWLELLKRGFVARGLQQDLMRYRMLEKSVSRNKTHSARWVWRTYREIEGLSRARAAWCFFHYAWNAFWKYRRF